ncbi:hypothetical protein GQ457_02G032050 [Hibiscus cannabinus]
MTSSEHCRYILYIPTENDTVSKHYDGAVHWLGYQERNNGGCSCAILGFDLSAEEFFVIGLPESLIGLNCSGLSAMKYWESSIAVLRRDREDGGLHELWVRRSMIPRALGFRKNGEVLMQVANGEIASLDLNCLQMEPRGVVVGDNLTTVDGSYVESLVLLDKGVNVPNMSYRFECIMDQMEVILLCVRNLHFK